MTTEKMESKLEKMYKLDTEYYMDVALRQGWEPKIQNYFSTVQVSPPPVKRNQVWSIRLEDDQLRMLKNENNLGNQIAPLLMFFAIFCFIFIFVAIFCFAAGVIMVSGKK